MSATNRTVTLTVDVQAKADSLTSMVSQVQKNLSGLSMPDNVSAGFKKDIDDLLARLQKVKNQTEGNQVKLVDSKKISSEMSKIESDFKSVINRINASGGKIKLGDSSAQKLSSALDGYLADVEKATDAYKKQQDEIKKTEAELKKLQEAEAKAKAKVQDKATKTEAAKAKQSSKLENLNNIDKSQADSGDTSSAAAIEARAKAKQEEANARGQVTRATKAEAAAQAELTAASKAITDSGLEEKLQQQKEALEQMGASAEEIATTQFEKLKEVISQLKSEGKIDIDWDPNDLQNIDDLKTKISALDEVDLKQVRAVLEDTGTVAKEAAKGATELHEGFDQDADSAKNLDNELEQMKNRVSTFFGLNNAVNLFKNAVKSAFDTVKELDDVMTETAVVTDFDIGDMWDQLPEYTARANELGVAIKDVYESMTIFYQQGLNTEQATALSNETLKMARIAGLDAAEATDRMTNALRGFNMELNETNAQRVDDVYNKLAAISASNVDEISTAMTKVASLANSANMEFETTSAFLSQMIETTRESAETAGTALKTVIARFQELKKDPSEIGEVDGEIVDANKVETALRTVGVALRDSEGQFRDLDDVFLELSSKWQDLDTNTQRYIATIAAGSRQQSRFIAMMSDYDRTMELVNAADNSAGSANEMYGKTLESLETKLNKLKNAWNEFLMSIADNGAIKAVVDALTWLLNSINKVTGILPGFLSGLAKIGIVAGGLKLGKSLTDSLLGNIGDQLLSKGKEAGENLAKGVQEGTNKLTLKNIFSKDFWEKNAITMPATQIDTAGLEKYRKSYEGLYVTLKKNRIASDKATTDTTNNIIELDNWLTGMRIDLQNMTEGTDEYIKTQDGLAAGQELMNELNSTFNTDLAENTRLRNIENALDNAHLTGVQKNVILMQAQNDATLQAELETGKLSAATIEAAMAQHSENSAVAATVAADELAVQEEERLDKVRKSGLVGLLATTIAEVKEGKTLKETTLWKLADKEATAENSKVRFKHIVAVLTGNKALLIEKVLTVKDTIAKAAHGIANTAATIAQEGFNAALETCPLGWIIILIVAAIAVIALLVIGLCNAKTATEQANEALEEAQDDADKLAEGAENAANAVDTLNDSLESLSEKYDALSDLTVGTKEWKEAVQEVNSEVMDLVDQYPELASLVTNEGGVLTIDTNSDEVQAVLDEYSDRAIKAEALSYNANIEVQKQKQNVAYTEVQDLNITKSRDLAEQMALDIASGTNLQGASTEDIQAYIKEKYGKRVDEDEIEALRAFGETLNLTNNAMETYYDALSANASELTSLTDEQREAASNFMDSEAMETKVNKAIDEADKITNKNRDVKREQYAKLQGYSTYADWKEDNDDEDIDDEKLQKALAEVDATEQAAETMELFANTVLPQLSEAAQHIYTGSEGSDLTQSDIEQLTGGLNYSEILDAGINKENLALSTEISRAWKSLSAEGQAAYENYGQFADDYREALELAANGFEQSLEKIKTAADDPDLTLDNFFNLEELNSGEFQKVADTVVTIMNKSGEEAGLKYMEEFDKVLGSAGDNVKSELTNYISTVDWTDMDSAVDALEYMRTLNLPDEEIESFWKVATAGAETFEASLENIITLMDRFHQNIVDTTDLMERFADGSATSEDLIKLIQAGVDVSDGSYELTADGWKATADAIDTATKKLLEYNAANAKLVAEQQASEIKTNVQKMISGGWHYDTETGTWSAPKGNNLLANITSKDSEGNLVADTITSSNVDSVASYLGISKDQYDSEADYITATQDALDKFIESVNHYEEKLWVLAEEAEFAEISVDPSGALSIASDTGKTSANVQAASAYAEQNDVDFDVASEWIDKYVESGLESTYTQAALSVIDTMKQAAAADLDEEEILGYSAELRKNGGYSAEEATEQAISFTQQAENQGLDIEEVREYALELQNASDKTLGLAEATSTAIEVMHESDEAGLDLEEVQTYAAALSEEFDDLPVGTAQKMAVDILRMNEGMEELAENGEEWAEALSDISNPKYASSLVALKKSLNNILGLSEDLPDSFYTNAKNLELMKKAAQGDTEALKELRKEAAKQKMIDIGVDEDTAESFDADIAKLLDKDYEIGATITADDESFLETMYKSMVEAGATAEEIQDAFDAIGWEPEFETETHTVTDTDRANGFAEVVDPLTQEKRRIKLDSNVTTGSTIQIPRLKGENGKSGFKGATYKGTSNTTYNSPSDTGGGSGSSSSSKKWENPYDELYNKTEELNEALREREKIEKRYDRLLRDRETTTKQLLANSLEEITNLRHQADIQQQLLNGRKKQLDEIGEATYTDDDGNTSTFEELGVTKYASYDTETGLIQIDWNAINRVRSESKGAAIEAYIDKLEELSDQYEETQDSLDDIEDELYEIQERSKESYLELEERIYDALVAQEQDKIDAYQTLSDAISDTNSEIINDLQESIELSRQIRDNTETEEDIADKEQRLAYLRRDTSNANAAEIRSLEKELEEAREDYSDTLIDQSIDKLSDDNDKAAEQREKQIEIMTAQLEMAQENGDYWPATYALLESSINEDGSLKNNSPLVDLLKQTDAFKGMSEFGQMQWIDDMIEEWLTAQEGLSNYKVDQARQTGSVTLDDGTSLTYDKTSKSWKDSAGQNYAVAWDSTSEQYTGSIIEDVDETDEEGEDGYETEGMVSDIERLLKKGMSGDDVADLQTALNELGFDCGDVDGKFGKKTLAAVKKFQKAAGLKADGKVGDKTKAAFAAKGYETGGLADYTGPAWLDGTYSKPELVLNATDTKNFIDLKDILAHMNQNGGLGSIGGDNYFSFDIDAEIGSDYDVDQMATRIKQIITDDATYRNVNSISWLR